MLKRFHFIDHKKITLIVLAVVVVIGAGSLLLRGLNIDIEFSGGSELRVDMGAPVTKEICDKINDLIRNDSQLGHQYVSSTTQASDDENTAIIRTGTKQLTNEQTMALRDALTKEFPASRVDKVDSISPAIGDSLRSTMYIAVAVAVVLMLIYIWIRFQLSSGLAAVVCLVHDLFVMLTIYSLFQIPINATIIAAFLTILGYSINATIIVFDRVRENRVKYGSEKEFKDIINISVHETLARSLNTTLTTLFTIGMIFIFGVESIRNFAFPLIVGIVAGLFSSVFLSGLLWYTFSKLFDSRRKKETKSRKAVKPKAKAAGSK